jgi:hypothetical protein
MQISSSVNFYLRRCVSDEIIHCIVYLQVRIHFLFNSKRYFLINLYTLMIYFFKMIVRDAQYIYINIVNS